MKTLATIEDRILQRINDEIGNDFKKLHRAAKIAEDYETRLKKIANKFSYDQENNASSFKTAFEHQEQASESINFQIEKLNQFGEKLSQRIEKSNKALELVSSDLDQVRQLQQLAGYLRIIEEIKELNNALTNALNGRDEIKIINLYLNLYEESNTEHCILGRLCNVNANFLKSFANSTATYWYGLLRERFVRDFEALLKTIRWGQKDQNLIHQKPSEDNITKAQILAECLFLYHFTGVKQTNRLDKPEWFYTQILNWGKETHLFVGQTFQPAAVKAGKIDFNIRLEFLRGLIQLTIEKLATDIEEISRDENLFAHLLDETLAFEAEIKENFGYPTSFPICADKMDAILHAENSWIVIDPNTFDDDLKIPKCADKFVCLLEAIKDRYYSLIQPGHQLQFLDLQLKLIDDFRRRLVQLHSNGVIESIPILNAINYVKMVLSEWGENVHYLHLHAALVGPNAEEVNSVFEHPVSELEHWTQELLKNLATKAVNEIKAKSMAYRHDGWPNMPEQNSREPFILSPSAGEMFQVMVTILHNFERKLSANLFNLTLRIIAKQIDDYILDSMVMNNKFSPAGAAQFNYDMTRNMFALFGQYSRRPDLLFKKIHDANKLLNISRGTALLLHETLNSNSSLEDEMKALRELGIVNFKPQTCIEILERRTDIRMH
uniref:RAD50-interacting protein 1 n=1 Tax=Glossina palpalis gambiensis TaxID=67801 RepID=A0A1B0B173_9MUSC